MKNLNERSVEDFLNLPLWKAEEISYEFACALIKGALGENKFHKLHNEIIENKRYWVRKLSYNLQIKLSYSNSNIDETNDEEWISHTFTL